MGKARRSHWGEEECMQDIGGEARREVATRRITRRWEDNIRMDLRERK
jgi:hypothetical protein